MKKRSLILSTALLLVAIMACTSATYAWFSNSKDAKVSNIMASVEQQSSLLIAKGHGVSASATASWKNNIDFSDTAYALSDVSSLDGTVFFARTVADDGTVSYGTAAAGTYIDIPFSLMSSSDNVKVYLKTATLGSEEAGNGFTEAARLAIVEGNNSKFVYEYKTTTSVTNAASDLGGTGADVKAITTSVGDGTPTAQDTITELSAANSAVATLAANTPVELNIRIWLEGQDASCVNSITGIEDILGSLLFTVA